MAQKNKIIKPRFFYDKNNKPAAVYLSIDDYNNFMDRLKKFSDEACQREMSLKLSSKPKSTLKAR